MAQRSLRDAQVRLRVLDERGRPVPPIRDEDRPHTRADCAPCAACQAARDVIQEIILRDGPIDRDALWIALHTTRLCGHNGGEMLMRSRPCIAVGCEFNTYLEVDGRTGRIRFNRPSLEPWEIDPRDSCTVDAAEEGERTFKEAGRAIGHTRSRAQQLFAGMINRVRQAALDVGIDPDDYDEPTEPEEYSVYVDRMSHLGSE